MCHEQENFLYTCLHLHSCFHRHVPLLCPLSPSLILPFIISLSVTLPSFSLLPASVFWLHMPLAAEDLPFLLIAAVWSGLLVLLPSITNTDLGLTGTNPSLNVRLVLGLFGCSPERASSSGLATVWLGYF